MPPLDQASTVNAADDVLPSCADCPHGAASVCDGQRLERLRRPLVLQPGQWLFTRDEPADVFYTLRTGMLSLSRTLADGRRQVVDFLTGGMPALPDTVVHVLDCQAVTEVHLCRFPRRAVIDLMAADPRLGLRVGALAGKALDRVREHAVLLGRKTALEKLASFLVDHMDEENRLVLHMSRADLADHLGLTVETVSRTMTLLRRNGLIQQPSGSRAMVLDRRTLDGLCGEG